MSSNPTATNTIAKPTSQAAALADARRTVAANVKALRFLVRAMLLSQMLVFSLLATVFAIVAVMGVVHSLSNMQKVDLSDIGTVATYLTAGSSGVLGAVVLPMFKRLHELTQNYLAYETRARQALTRAVYGDTIAKVVNAMNLLKS